MTDIPRDLAFELAPEYEILGELGRGGSSVVYLGRDPLLGRRVAIKVIRDSRLGDREAVTRFEREAHMLARLQHPNIVTLYAAKRLSGGTLVLVMQNGEWQTLKEVIRENGALPFTRVEQVLRDIGNALVYLHRHDVIHRDVKPENIFLDRESGRAMLSDFGIARFGDGHSSVTLAGSVLGTPAYMAPEQIDSAEQSYQSDIYSLGMVGYEMLTGVRPWHGESLYNVIYKQKTERLPPLESQRPGIPTHLHSTIERAIEKDPAVRWPTAEIFVRQLGIEHSPPPADESPIASTTPPSPRDEETEITVAFARQPVSGTPSADSPRRGSWRLATTGIVLLLCLGGAAAVVAAMTAEKRASRPEQTHAAMSLSPAVRSPLSQGPRAAPALDETPPRRILSTEPDRQPEELPAAESTIVETAPSLPPRARAEPRSSMPAREGALDSTEPIGEPVAPRNPPVLGEAIAEQPQPPRHSPAVEVVTPLPAASPSGTVGPGTRDDVPLTPPALRNASDLTRVLRALPPTELRRVQGNTIVIALLVNEAGRVEDSRIKTSSGASQLDRALLEVVKALRFTPAARLGQAESAWVDLPIILGGGRS